MLQNQKDSYLNTTNLKISGQKIKLQKFPHDAKPHYNVRQITLTPEPAVIKELPRVKEPLPNREVYKLNVTNYTNSELHNYRLKSFQEALEHRDFKRFLAKGYRKNVYNNSFSVLNSIDAGRIYDDYFKVHYDFLKGVSKDLQRTQ